MRRPHFVLGRQRLRPQRCRQAPEPAALSEASNDDEGHGEKKRALKAAHAQPRSEHGELEAASQEREKNGAQPEARCEVEQPLSDRVAALSLRLNGIHEKECTGGCSVSWMCLFFL